LRLSASALQQKCLLDRKRSYLTEKGLFSRKALLSGWIEYYGRYAPSALSPMLRYVNLRLLRWAMRKFKRFKAHKIRASHFLQRLARDKMSLFVHWRIGMTGTFA